MSDHDILILPVADRERSRAAFHGRKQADHDAFGPLMCKPLAAATSASTGRSGSPRSATAGSTPLDAG